MMGLTLLNHNKLQWTLRDPRLARHRLLREGAAVSPPTGSSWGSPTSPGVAAAGIAGRLTLPTVGAAALDDALGRGPGGARAVLDSLAWCHAHEGARDVFRAPHLSHAASEVVKRELAEPLARALRGGGGGGACCGLGPATTPLDPRWAHAAIVSQVQPADAFRHCDVAWHRGKGCMQAHALEALPIVLRRVQVGGRPIQSSPLPLEARYPAVIAPLAGASASMGPSTRCPS